MDKREFFSIYLNALEKALANDHINYGYLVKAPDFYMDSAVVRRMDKFMEDELYGNEFVNFVEEYFDAKSHNFPDMYKMDIGDARDHIISEMKKIRVEYSL